MAKGSRSRLVWIDLEMTGLDPERCTIIEIASVITDDALEVIAEGPCRVIHQPSEVLEQMDAEVTELHRKSGLLDVVAASSVSLSQAASETLAFFKEHCREHTAPLCGNSIWKDRQFLARYMPAVSGYLHYRCIDVSSIKELVRRWYGGRIKAPKKGEAHRALDDIRESIAELAFYRQQVFRELA